MFTELAQVNYVTLKHECFIRVIDCSITVFLSELL